MIEVSTPSVPRRRMLHFLFAPSERIPDAVWGHYMMCQCKVCVEFYAEADNPPDRCWVTGEEIKWVEG